ncbi:MAG: DMT family transporter [Paracoccaceae bacterium]
MTVPRALSAHPPRHHAPGRAIAFVLGAVVCLSVNDMLIKALSGDYPLHQMVFVRSATGILFSIAMLQFEGGFAALRTDRPGLHALRAGFLVVANMTFFAALAVMPLAAATALFFVSPLFITLLSIPVLGERVGPRRLAAVGVGLCGVAVMLAPKIANAAPAEAVPLVVLCLPVVAAFAYASTQVLTRRLGAAMPASAMAMYLQGCFLGVSLLIGLIAGDGRYADGFENESARFLLRAWTWPTPEDWPLFILLGAMSAVIGYALSQAYRSADAGVVAPFEYVALPLAIFWGWTVFGEIPGPWTLAGIALIGGAGLYVFLRETERSAPAHGGRPVRR